MSSWRPLRSWACDSRGPALDDVGDVDVLTRQAHALGDHVGEQLAGGADEGLAGAVLVGARGLADEHQPGRRGAGAEDGLRAGRGEVRAPAARGDLGRRRSEQGRPFVRGDRGRLESRIAEQRRPRTRQDGRGLRRRDRPGGFVRGPWSVVRGLLLGGRDDRSGYGVRGSTELGVASGRSTPDRARGSRITGAAAAGFAPARM